MENAAVASPVVASLALPAAVAAERIVAAAAAVVVAPPVAASHAAVVAELVAADVADTGDVGTDSAAETVLVVIR